MGGARALLESALRAVHGLEVGLQAGEALRVQAARRQVQQLFSEEKDYYTVFSSKLCSLDHFYLSVCIPVLDNRSSPFSQIKRISIVWRL